MLAGPRVLETDAVGYFDEGNLFAQHVVFGALSAPVNRVVHLIEQTEFHD